ncbi:hypothetical protein KSS87_016871 [Heliosperma pusillum]|nr:hypothetical protein KSS87_016871 [Heliosperma pusillum]
MRPPEPTTPPYIARLEKIETAVRGGARVYVRWYYRPEESIGGRRQFHGANEVFLSDHFDMQSADSIEAKCTVHSFKSYTKLDSIGNDDFFCRFEYNSATGAFTPDRVAVSVLSLFLELSPNIEFFVAGFDDVIYCKCEMPYNPDDLMVQCEGCSDWFHPACIEMTAEEAKRLDHFFCQNCSDDDLKTLHDLQHSHAASRHSDAKFSPVPRPLLSYQHRCFLVKYHHSLNYKGLPISHGLVDSTILVN